MTAPSTPQWFKSSHSGGSGTECVECALANGGVLVRDSKRRSGPALAIQGHAWRDFVLSLSRHASEDHQVGQAAPSL